jgi:hypothetical protein
MILSGVNERLRCYEYLPGHRFAPHNVRKTNAKATISFYIADREGWAQASTALGEKFNPFNLAAAVAIIKASCGWDESPSIVE